MGDYPLLVLPPGTVVEPLPARTRRFITQNPSKARQIARLEPEFKELAKALEGHHGAVSSSALGAGPEHILVFETNGPCIELLDMIAKTPELDWLLEGEKRVPPNEDFKKKRLDRTSGLLEDSDAELTAVLYMVLFNQAALQQLLSAWTTYSTEKRMPKGLGAWSALFRCLRSVRRWGPQDRLRDAELLRDALEPVDPARLIPVEIELWPREGERRSRAEAHVRNLITRAGGTVIHSATIDEIRYHALLAQLPHGQLASLLETNDADLIQADDIYLLRPTPQASATVDVTEVREGPATRREDVIGEPVCALLDGLPMENHPQLQGHLVVDDPDGWAATYPVVDRRHGTAMASLIVHGDQNEPAPALRRPLYARPILMPTAGTERAPRGRLWLDLIHEAVRRVVADDAPNGPVAPSVRIINLSVGDPGRPFLHEPSPLARLLDWLAWKHQVLFIVSAGNHRASLPAACTDDAEILCHLFAARLHRRILSPAETINGITVGALNSGGAEAPSASDQRTIPMRLDLPAAYSALGRGFRRAVKPDVLSPGGRLSFRRRLPATDGEWTHVEPQPMGQVVAVPGPPGSRQVAFLSGTSNAAALTSRAACMTFETIEQLLMSSDGTALHGVPVALLLKALLVHSADWPDDVHGFVAQSLSTLLHPSRKRDELSGLLGYGFLRPERSIACEPHRATAVGGGAIALGERILHRWPIPSTLHVYQDWRRFTATLAWFSPISPGNRRYRVARLGMDLPKNSPLAVEGVQVHRDATGRGTVEHVILEGRDAVINVVGGHEYLDVAITCGDDAPCLSGPVPYALALSLEVAPGTTLPLYESIAERLRAGKVPVPVTRP